MKVSQIVRSVLHALTVLGTVAALVLVIISMLTPYWRHANSLERNAKETKQFGLWQNCLQLTMPKKTTCEWKKGIPDVNPRGREEHPDHNRILENIQEHKYMTAWERNTLILLSVSTLFGVLAVLFGVVGLFVDFCNYKPVFKGMCFAWIACLFIACILALSGLLVYLRYSFEKENRTVKETKSISPLELFYGASFYNCMYGVVLYGVSFVFALICTILVCVMSHLAKYDYVEVPHRSHGGHDIVSDV